MLDDIGAAIADFFAREHDDGPRQPSRRRGRTTVPDVRGLNVDEARRTLGREGLRLEVHRLQERPAPVMGTVVDQDPEPGTRHRRAKPVRIYVQHLRDP